MGSLPNLHELGRDENEYPPQTKSGPYPVQIPEDKSKSYYRHSGHCKITKARSNGHGSKIVYDDFMLEQMAAYSPVSSRSTRNLQHNIRRRDSMNSSIGATSVRRLIAVVRNTHSRVGPVYSRRILIKNLIVLCASHILITATFLPFLALQSSVSVWSLPLQNEVLPISINVGSLLLMVLHLSAAISSILSPSMVQKLGCNVIFFVSYIVFCIFYASHHYPVLYLLVPMYILLGLVLGPIWLARVTFLMTLSSKMSYIFSEDDEEAKILRRTCIIRRVARAFQAAHDFGLILGSVLSAVLITYTINLDSSGFIFTTNATSNGTVIDRGCQTDYLNSTVPCTNMSDLFRNCSRQETNAVDNVYDYSSFLDDIFDVDESGDRLCGSQACPSSFVLSFNMSDESYFHVLPKTTAAILAGVYVGLGVLALLISVVGLDKLRMYVYQDPLERPEGLAALRAVRESFRDVRLQLSAPLAVFIGLEQAFMYADFGKSYVVCTLGIHRLNLVFLCMGLLQSIAACTLSMLLRSIRRYYVVAVGFTFHACLLMVQMVWKPIGDDPALFYVISAAWGVCNAIWEMLNFTVLTGLYADNWEAPFANSTFFRFIGLSIAFGFHGFICNYIKLYFLAFFMLFAVIPFTWLEIKLESMRKVKTISRL